MATNTEFIAFLENVIIGHPLEEWQKDQLSSWFAVRYPGFVVDQDLEYKETVVLGDFVNLVNHEGEFVATVSTKNSGEDDAKIASGG